MLQDLDFQCTSSLVKCGALFTKRGTLFVMRGALHVQVCCTVRPFRLVLVLISLPKRRKLRCC